MRVERALYGVVTLLAVVALAGCDVTLVGGLTEAQANGVLVALDGQGIASEKELEESRADVASHRVLVGRHDVPGALGVLRALDLPQTPEPGFQDIFGQGGLVPTATEERARYVVALGGELSRTIEAIDGVLEARVHVALPDGADRALDEPEPRPRASVMIKHRPGKRPYDDARIRELVAGAVSGMRPADVAVIGVMGRALARGRGDNRLVRVGPIAVTRGTSAALKMILGAALVLDILLAALLVAMLTRRHRVTQAPAASRIA